MLEQTAMVTGWAICAAAVQWVQLAVTSPSRSFVQFQRVFPAKES